MPSQQPVPCISGGPDIATVAWPASRSCFARPGSALGSGTGASPTICGYVLRKNSVKPDSGYITPFGMPVVPPV